MERTHYAPLLLRPRQVSSPQLDSQRYFSRGPLPLFLPFPAFLSFLRLSLTQMRCCSFVMGQYAEEQPENNGHMAGYSNDLELGFEGA